MAKYKALLIDDNTQFTESVKGYLLSQDRFSEVDTAQDGREALKKLREKTYDVMTLDLIMPNADGLAVLEQLSLLPLDPAPAVVVISALKNEAMVRRCCGLGARYYMVKPVDPDTIHKRLLETLEGDLQAAHWICNSSKGAKVGPPAAAAPQRVFVRDGDW